MSGTGELRAERARAILETCRHGLAGLRRNPVAHDWMIQWAGTLALLRTVGDALKKVDANTDLRLAGAQTDWWNRIKVSKPAIFFEFIRRDRNLLLHEAKSNAGQSAMVHLQSVEVRAAAAGFAGVYSPPPPAEPQLPPLPPKYGYHVNDGPFAGRDPRELVEESIRWWEQQIASIEQDAATRP